MPSAGKVQRACSVKCRAAKLAVILSSTSQCCSRYSPLRKLHMAGKSTSGTCERHDPVHTHAVFPVSSGNPCIPAPPPGRCRPQAQRPPCAPPRQPPQARRPPAPWATPEQAQLHQVGPSHNALNTVPSAIKKLSNRAQTISTWMHISDRVHPHLHCQGPAMLCGSPGLIRGCPSLPSGMCPHHLQAGHLQYGTGDLRSARRACLAEARDARHVLLHAQTSHQTC